MCLPYSTILNVFNQIIELKTYKTRILYFCYIKLILKSIYYRLSYFYFFLSQMTKLCRITKHKIMLFYIKYIKQNPKMASCVPNLSKSKSPTITFFFYFCFPLSTHYFIRQTINVWKQQFTSF